MTACSAVAPTVTSRVIKSNLHVSSDLVEQLDPMELSSVNELLDRIAALAVATNYDQVGLKPDLREINSPQVTHHVAVVEAQCGDPSSILRTSYVRIPEPSKPDTRGGEGTTQDLSLESGNGLDSLDNIQDSKLQSSELFGLRIPNWVRSQIQRHPPARTQAILPKSGKSPRKKYITTGPDSSWL